MIKKRPRKQAINFKRDLSLCGTSLIIHNSCITNLSRACFFRSTARENITLRFVEQKKNH